MNTPVIYINIQSAVPVELNLYDSSQNLLDPAAVSFKLVYIDRKKTRYEVERRLANELQEEYFKNCYIENGRLFVRFENTGFATGKLERELWLIQDIEPDKGEGFANGEMKCVITEISAIEIVSGVEPSDCPENKQYEKQNIIGVETIVFPCVEYVGIKAPQCEIIVNDFINNKREVADAINDKGGNANEKDSMTELADKIRELVPVEPVFQTSGNLNPKWTDLQSKIAENYREDRKYAWAFSFLGENKTIELTGGDYYICSDGYESAQSEMRVFGANPDESKTDHWLIIYTRTPVFVFPSDLFVIGAAFYNTSSEQVKFQNTKTVFISQTGVVENTTLNIPDYFAQNTSISYFIIPDGVEDVTISDYAFDGCRNLIDFTFPESIEKVLFKTYACRNTFINQLIFNNTLFPQLKSFSTEQHAFYSSFNTDIIEIETTDEIVVSNNCFQNTVANKVILKSNNINLGGYAFQSSKEARIMALGTLKTGQYSFGGISDKLFLKNPAISFTPTIVSFWSCESKIIELEDGWSWPIILSTATYQTVESMYQNVQALADRTGQTPNTLTFGANKLAALLAAYPDASEIASNKNWNLA